MSTRPQTVNEIEEDLKLFLQTISPILSVVTKNKNRSALYTASIALRKVLSDDKLLENLAHLQPLLEKYSYLVNEH